MKPVSCIALVYIAFGIGQPCMGSCCIGDSSPTRWSLTLPGGINDAPVRRGQL